MQLLLQQYIEYTKNNNNNSRLTLCKLELISDIYPTRILWNKVILVKWNQIEYAALDSLKCFSLLRPCRVSFSLNIRDMLHLILYGVWVEKYCVPYWDLLTVMPLDKKMNGKQKHPICSFLLERLVWIYQYRVN